MNKIFGILVVAFVFLLPVNSFALTVGGQDVSDEEASKYVESIKPDTTPADVQQRPVVPPETAPTQKNGEAKKGTAEEKEKKPVVEPASSLERSFSRPTVTLQDKVETDPFKRELKQFGYEYFKNSLTTALGNLPVGNDYVIGPGDSI